MMMMMNMMKTAADAGDVLCFQPGLTVHLKRMKKKSNDEHDGKEHENYQA